MFFRKNKPKQEATLAPVDAKQVPVTKNTLPPFHPSPRCPKCCSWSVPQAVYCKGKKFLRGGCEHKLKGEHLHRSCTACGFRWAHAVNTDAELDKFEEPKGMVALTKFSDNIAATPKVKVKPHNPLEGLGFSDDFLTEVKELQASSSVKEIPPLPVNSDRNQYKALKVLPKEVVPEEPPFLTEAKAKFSHDHYPLAGACPREQIVNVLWELAGAVRAGNKETALNCVAQATAYVNLL